MKEIKLDKKELTILKKLIELQISNLISLRIRDEIPILENILKKINRSEKKIKPSSAKAKGREFQYYVCRKIAEKFNIEFNQNDDDCPIHSREMGQHGKDIILRGEIYEKFPFDIECKNQENISLIEWVKQARANENKNKNWVLAIKNRKLDNPIICMDFDDFLNLFFKNIKYKEK